MDQPQTTGLELEADEDLKRTGERIIALVVAGKLDPHGDPARWRHNEVRLPPHAAMGPFKLPSQAKGGTQDGVNSHTAADKSLIVLNAVGPKPKFDATGARQ